MVEASGPLADLKLSAFLAARQIVYWLQRVFRTPSANGYLMGNFAPTQSQVLEQDLHVVGQIPEGLKGAYCRTGPNPLLSPAGGYHWFDGDGMLHACRFKDGKVSYCNRYIQTNRLNQEQRAQRPIFGRYGDIQGIWGLVHLMLDQLAGKAGVWNDQHGKGQANTALVFHAKRLLSLHEGDLPYAVTIACNGLIETIGRVLDGQVDHPMIAHPKADPDTGELFWIGYNVDKKPHVVYSALDAKGQVMFDCPVNIPVPVMMHDLQITADYAIILDTCVEFSPKEMVQSGGLPFGFNSTRPSRFGIIDKRQPQGSTQPAKARWFELDPMQIFHTINAWQEGPLVRLFTCYMPTWDMKDTTPDSILMAELSFNLDTGEARKRDFAPGITAEFPKVPAHMQGCLNLVRQVWMSSEPHDDDAMTPHCTDWRKTRFAYLAEMDEAACQRSALPMMRGLIKVDLSLPGDQAVVGRISHGQNVFGGEAFFVPAHEDVSRCKSEDDGYLITFVHNEKAHDSNGSELVIYDAKTFSSQAVARVAMPQRVPYGFHSTWVPEHEFQQQWQASGLPGVFPTNGKH